MSDTFMQGNLDDMKGKAVSKQIMLSEDRMNYYGHFLPAALLNADSARSKYIEEVKRGRKLVSTTQKREHIPFEGAYDGHVPALRSDRDALVARMSRALLSVTPMISVTGYGPSAQFKSEVEKFLQIQLTQQVNIRRTLERIIQASFDDGVALAYIRWETISRDTYEWSQEMISVQNSAGEPPTQVPGKITKDKKTALYYDGPRIDYIPIENAGVYPVEGADLQRSEGVYIRYTVSGDDLLIGQRNGDFDEDAVKYMSTNGADTDLISTDTDETRRLDTTAMADDDFHSREFQLTDCYWRVVVKKDMPAEDWLITIHERTGKILRAIPNPWFKGVRPLVAFSPFLDKAGIFGDSLYDKSGQYQKARTALLRMAMDAMTLGINYEIVIPKSGGVQLRADIKKNRGPMGIIQVPDQYVNAIKPLGTGYSPNVVIPLTEAIKADSDRATGVSDTFRGVSGPHTMTATEVDQMMSSGQELLSMMMDRESDAISELVKYMLVLDAQFCNSPEIIKYWQLANPTFQGPVWQVLQGEYFVQAAGTTDTGNRANRAQRADKLMAVVGQSPFVQMSMTRQYKVLKYWLSENGYDDMDAYIGTEEQAAQIDQAKHAVDMSTAQLNHHHQNNAGGMQDGQPGGSDAGSGQLNDGAATNTNPQPAGSNGSSGLGNFIGPNGPGGQ